MDSKLLLTGITGISTALVAGFLVIFGAVQGEMGLLVTGWTVLSSGFTAMITYHFSSETIKNLRAEVKNLSVGK